MVDRKLVIFISILSLVVLVPFIQNPSAVLQPDYSIYDKISNNINSNPLFSIKPQRIVCPPENPDCLDQGGFNNPTYKYQRKFLILKPDNKIRTIQGKIQNLTVLATHGHDTNKVDGKMVIFADTISRQVP